MPVPVGQPAVGVEQFVQGPRQSMLNGFVEAPGHAWQELEPDERDHENEPFRRILVMS